MDSSEKNSYKINKILKKLTGIPFLKAKQTIDLSKEGKEKSRQFTSSEKHPPSQGLQKADGSYTDLFVRYQRELEACRALGTETKPSPPGRILKLPTGRKELMSKSKE